MWEKGIQIWSGHLGKVVLSDVICLNSSKSLLLGHQMVCRSSQDLVLSLDVSHEGNSLFPGVWQHKCWSAVPDKGLSRKARKCFRGCLFQQMKNPGCKLWCIRLLSPGSSLGKDCSTKAWLVLMETVRPLHHWRISSFINCASDEAGTKCIGHPVSISKDERVWVPSSNALGQCVAWGQGIWKVSTNFARWVLIVLLVCVTENQR